MRGSKPFLNSAITNPGNTVTNLSSARSRIEDSDYAEVPTCLARADSAAVVGTVLALYNRVPQNVPSLLR